jgi:hypothetical protein
MRPGVSERYEYIPASMKVIQDVCLKYGCDCTMKTNSKPPQPIEKSTQERVYGASDRGEMGRSPTAAPAGEECSSGILDLRAR